MSRTVSPGSATGQPPDARAAAGPARDLCLAGSRGLNLVRGEGPYVFDDAGRRYFDATSMMGVAVLGHAHPAIARAVAEQARELVACSASFGSPVREALVARLGERLAPLDRLFFCNSGTESVEAAIKFARHLTGRPGVVALARAFHGRTFGSLSATWRAHHRAGAGPLLESFRHVAPGDLDGLSEALRARDVGLVLVEVVQGEGGVHVLDGTFLQAVQELCRTHGTLFGIDEVQTGMGRTGRWFGFRHHGLDPDLVCLAKGLAGGVPIGATALRASAGELPQGAHGSTFGGNPLACAAALATIGVLEDHALVEAAAVRGELLRAALREHCGSAASDVRGLGLMVGVELPGGVVPVLRSLQARGFLALGAGRRVLRLLPPLISTEEQLEALAAAVGQCVRAEVSA